MAEQPQARAEPAPARIRVGLRFSLLMVALATVALTAAAVHIPWNIASRDNLGDMVRSSTARS